MNIPPYFNQYKKMIEEYLMDALTNKDSDIDLIIESARYSVMAGGKRMRGAIVLAIGSLYDDTEKFLPLAAAVEMIHAYSLIHDDLPAMDDDDFRRGKLSNHKVYGEDIAILAGDFLVTKAYGIIADGLMGNGFDAQNVVKVVGYLSSALGSQGMVGGQVMDIKSSKDICCDIGKLRKIHELKTGRFIRASFICPLILCTGKDDLPGVFSLVEYADTLGLLFQVIDDILDETSDQETLGKPIGSDKDNNKATYVSLMGLAGAKKYAKNIYEEMIGSLDVLEERIKNVLMDFAKIVYKRNN
ncbi:MAG: polyprenyl synthetase family protein [Candidatus Margulisbacteria bacterium]|nr:polyprenyl synthetase family protein [Candidatus Margulisiibacteriota bacterium]